MEVGVISLQFIAIHNEANISPQNLWRNIYVWEIRFSRRLFLAVALRVHEIKTTRNFGGQQIPNRRRRRTQDTTLFYTTGTPTLDKPVPTPDPLIARAGSPYRFQGTTRTIFIFFPSNSFPLTSPAVDILLLCPANDRFFPSRSRRKITQRAAMNHRRPDTPPPCAVG